MGHGIGYIDADFLAATTLPKVAVSTRNKQLDVIAHELSWHMRSPHIEQVAEEVAPIGLVCPKCVTNCSTKPDVTQISSYCPLCISRCGCIYTVEGGELTAVAPNPDHPTGKHLCSKAYAAVDLLQRPDRILTPLKRSNPKGSADPGWQRIGWDEALHTTATAMRRIAAQDGPEAMAFCVTTPSGTAVADGMQWIFRLANAFGSPNTVWTTHVCNWHR